MISKGAGIQVPLHLPPKDVLMHSYTTEQHDLLEGDVWEVHEGVLHVPDNVGHVVASYAAGKWLNVVKR